MKLKVGSKAPDFELLDQNNKNHKLSNYLGKKVILYFYPKDDTPGCTTEACNFRDVYTDYSKLGIIVLGVSMDSVNSHKKFSDKYKLNFPILSDNEKIVVNKYDVIGEKKFMGKVYNGILRTTFIIDEKGKIIKIFENVSPKEHNNEILEFLDTKK